MKVSRWKTHLSKRGALIVLFCMLCGLSAQGTIRQGFAQSQQNTSTPYKVYLPGIMNVKVLPPPPNTPPLASPSYYFYMRYYTPAKARAFGCELGTRDKNLPGKQESLVILDFGITKYQNGQYGASGMMIGGFVTLDQVADAVEQFGLGYWDCTDQDYDSIVHLGIGTNNYNNSNVYSNLSVTYDHGRAWAQMVNRVNDWFVNVCPDRCNGQVDAAGANDIELAWSSPQAAIDWVGGYDSANLYPLYNFGAAEGCPNACGGGGYYWTKDQVLKVTNFGPIHAVPEIYLNNGVNANQWYQLSAYSVKVYGFPHDFAGVMTTYGACQQYPEAECEYLDNKPEEGWQQLYNKINGSDLTTFDSLPYSTDISWTE